MLLPDVYNIHTFLNPLSQHLHVFRLLFIYFLKIKTRRLRHSHRDCEPRRCPVSNIDARDTTSIAVSAAGSEIAMLLWSLSKLSYLQSSYFLVSDCSRLSDPWLRNSKGFSTNGRRCSEDDLLLAAAFAPRRDGIELIL